MRLPSSLTKSGQRPLSSSATTPTRSIARCNVLRRFQRMCREVSKRTRASTRTNRAGCDAVGARARARRPGECSAARRRAARLTASVASTQRVHALLGGYCSHAPRNRARKTASDVSTIVCGRQRKLVSSKRTSSASTNGLAATFDVLHQSACDVLSSGRTPAWACAARRPSSGRSRRDSRRGCGTR